MQGTGPWKHQRNAFLQLVLVGVSSGSAIHSSRFINEPERCSGMAIADPSAVAATIETSGCQAKPTDELRSARHST